MDEAEVAWRRAKGQKRKRPRPSRGSSTRIVGADPMDQQLDEDLSAMKTYMEEDSARAKEQVALLRDIKDGLAVIAAGQTELKEGMGRISGTQHHTAEILNQVGSVLTHMLNKQT